MKKRRKSILRRLSLFSALFSLIIALIVAYFAFSIAFKPNIIIPQGKKKISLYIHTGWNYSDLYKELEKRHLLRHYHYFNIVAKLRHLPQHIHAGRYFITSGMTNMQLVHKLRSGEQDPVEVTFNNIRTKAELAGNISKQIEADSADLAKLLNENSFDKKYGFNKENILCMFLPNTYQFYWNTSAEGFMKKMDEAYQSFWTEKRKKKAKKIGLTPVKVSILASIVTAEQSVHSSEWSRIAGLYINRLKRGIPLQSDPTVIYAIGDFSIRRVLDSQKEFKSPYNTYLNKGLPPGPINLPDIAALKAVLNYEQNDYIYMCAKADFSGYHNFATNLKQHLIYARQYQQALNKMHIMN